MNPLVTSLRHRFPSSWSISNSTSGAIEIFDTSIDKGKGYRLNVHETLNFYQAVLEFEDFAKYLVTHSEEQLKNEGHPFRRVLMSKNNVQLKRYRRTIEDAFDPNKVRDDGWWLELGYRKNNTCSSDENSFADLLLSLLLFLLPYDVEAEEEGAEQNLFTTKYERSHLNRSLCLAFHGYACKVCSLNLEEMYGETARQFIHVHHLNPVSISGVVKPDPINDMVPLCPNCHSIAHRRNPPYSVEEIKKMINRNNGKVFT